MANYNIKQQAKVYIRTNNTFYQIEVQENLSFSQTFADSVTAVKTVQNSTDYFGRSNIKKANVANFSFTMLIIKQNYFKKVHDLLLSGDSFDLYIETNQDIWKLEKAVITEGAYQIERSEPLKLNVNGKASKLSKYGTVGSVTFPFGTVDLNYNTGAKDYLMPKYLQVIVGGTDISSGIVSLKAQLQNSVQWLKNHTVQAALNVTNETNAIFPQDYVITKKSFAGSIGSYLRDDNDNFLNKFNEATSLSIKAGELDSNSTFHGFYFNLGSGAVSFTNRMEAKSVFTQSTDWKLVTNPTLSTSIIYSTV